MQERFFDRDISWLSFNHRVLQEARDRRVPLYERLKFLAIYSSNLDEFYRVRVASLRSFKKLRKKTRQQYHMHPRRTLQQVQKIVQRQQLLFGETFREEIIPDLSSKGINLITDAQFDAPQQAFAVQYFDEHLAPILKPLFLAPGIRAPFLKNKSLYFVAQTADNAHVAVLVEIPSEEKGRFVVLPSQDGGHFITFLDDIIRFNLNRFLPDAIQGAAYSIKLSRDAELYIDDELSGNLIEKIKQGLEGRASGLPTRFLYDASIPPELLDPLIEIFQLKKGDLIPGARYHNFSDFFDFPEPPGIPGLRDESMSPLPHPFLQDASSILGSVRRNDQLLHYPYQTFGYLLSLLREAADLPIVHSIKITLYRIAAESEIAKALAYALEKGKEVTVFVEAKARFDEATNLVWGQRLQDAGARIIYSIPNLKVHAKALLITTRAKRGPAHYAYLSTGNFNEKTSFVYADHALLTADIQITEEVAQLFSFLEGSSPGPEFQSLLVAPLTLRERLTALVDREIHHAQMGREAYIILKMNSLEDRKMIDKLYEASNAGVRIYLIIRGICCLRPGVAKLSENIVAISVVDRFLEHARIFLFGNAGQEECYLSSADWMTRNLDHRVEVAFPIRNPDRLKELRTLLEIQLGGNLKARILDSKQENQYVTREPHQPYIQAQPAFYQYLNSLL
ncbi:MAG: polyphosphate kinase 1 [Saprospirales bacterium]|nr:polyphosphate kinase 1 [Saprospirales bacterium]MBK8490363.1 polyphosphate kinase 1 [Saprospirales bacterium]